MRHRDEGGGGGGEGGGGGRGEGKIRKALRWEEKGRSKKGEPNYEMLSFLPLNHHQNLRREKQHESKKMKGRRRGVRRSRRRRRSRRKAKGGWKKCLIIDRLGFFKVIWGCMI